MVDSAVAITKLLDDYLSWVRDNTSLRTLNGEWVEITTPYVDRHNDLLQIFVRKTREGLLLTDDGYIVRDLESAGCKLDSPKRQDLLRTTLNAFGIGLNQGALETLATEANFPVRKHNLVQAMLAVNDLFYLAQPMVAGLFWDDVVAWLDENDVRYTPRPKFTGISGYDHLFDFVVPKSRKQPERILQAINRPSRDSAEAFIHRWSDTRETRPPESRAYAILNDSESPIPGGVIEAFRNYAINPVLWSGRQQYVAEIAA
jgi:hypothetical protein